MNDIHELRKLIIAGEPVPEAAVFNLYDKTIKNTKPYNTSAPSTEEIDALAVAFSNVTKGSGIRDKNLR